MSKKTLYILGIILTAIIGAFLQWTLCCNCCKTPEEKVITPVVTPKEEPAIPETPEVSKIGLAINDPQGDFDYRINDNFNFNDSQFAILTPVSTKVDDIVTKLKDYFGTNANKVIKITGHYKSTEENPSAFPDLGIARANAVKNYLVSKGIASKQIDLDSKLNDDLKPEDTIYYGPVTYGISTMENDNSAEMDALKAEINANPLTLYFETGSSNVKLSSAQRLKMQKISSYIDKVDGSAVNVVGHTDSRGNAKKNIALGLDRAKTIATYLGNNGIDNSRIETSSDGPNKPIATNNTETGRSRNRRVEVTLK